MFCITLGQPSQDLTFLNDIFWRKKSPKRFPQKFMKHYFSKLTAAPANKKKRCDCFPECTAVNFLVFESVILSKINLNSQIKKTYSIIKTKMQFLFNIFVLKQIKKTFHTNPCFNLRSLNSFKF